MSAKFELIAEFRDDKGKGASRRLRRQGRVPVILYGGGREPRSLSVEQESLLHQLESESFYSSILNIKVAGEDQDAIIKDIQRHPARNLVTHLDLQRVVAGEKIRVNIPLHFVNEDVAVGVKTGGGTVFHNITEIEISVLPQDLPEFIDVDVADLELGQAIHVSEIQLPEGAEIVGATEGEDRPVVAIQRIKVVEEEPVEGAEEEAAAEGEEGEAPEAEPDVGDEPAAD